MYEFIMSLPKYPVETVDTIVCIGAFLAYGGLALWLIRDELAEDLRDLKRRRACHRRGDGREDLGAERAKPRRRKAERPRRTARDTRRGDERGNLRASRTPRQQERGMGRPAA